MDYRFSRHGRRPKPGASWGLWRRMGWVHLARQCLVPKNALIGETYSMWLLLVLGSFNKIIKYIYIYNIYIYIYNIYSNIYIYNYIYMYIYNIITSICIYLRSLSRYFDVRQGPKV